MKLEINWDCIETVFLDMDGTLLDLEFDNYFWHEYVPVKYSQLNSIEHAQAKDMLIGMYNSKRGTLDWYCTDYWTERLGLNIAALKKEIASRVSLFPTTIKFLDWLQDSCKEVVLLTNAHLDSVNIKLDQTGIGSKFSQIITSHDYGHAKEAAEFWLQLAANHDHDRASTLFIDDNIHVLNAARDYGIKYLVSIHRPDSSQPIQDTQGFMALNDFDEIINELD